MAKGNDGANAKGKVRLECAAAVQFMRTRRWETLIAVCLEEGGMNNKRVGGRPWGDVCRQWWDNFAKMCIYAWRTSWLSGADLGRLRECSIAMGKAHLLLEWPKLPLNMSRRCGRRAKRCIWQMHFSMMVMPCVFTKGIPKKTRLERTTH